MQAVIQRAAASARPQRALQTGPAASEGVAQRLAAEFPTLGAAAVERCVIDTWICAEHLGLAVTAGLVERVAREHLLGMVNSVPPSGRRRRG